MKKKSQVIMLPTEKASKLAFLTKKGEEVYKDLRYFHTSMPNHRDIDLTRPQHLYFITDEKIKEGDWVFGSILKDNIALVDYDLLCDLTRDQLNISKIIATTNDSLMVYNNKGIMKSLPRPSNEFLKAYCESYSSNNPITEVNIEYVKLPVWHSRCPNGTMITKIVGHTNTIKVAPDNTITISKVEERMFTLEELTKLVKSAWYTGIDRGKYKEDLQPSYENEFINGWLKDKLK